MPHRKDLREAARAAMRVAFPALTERLVYDLAINPEKTGAVWAVNTPRETSEPFTKQTTARMVMLQVILKREGDGLEDQFDEDSAVIESAVLPALTALGEAVWDVQLTETLTEFDKQGGRATGNLILRIACRVETNNPD